MPAPGLQRPGRGAATALRIERAGPSDETVLANLFQLYFHELSAWLEADVENDGRFDAWDSEAFRDPDNAAWLLWMGDKLAGCLVVEMVDTPLGRMTEFADLFVLRRYRRQGLAMEVVRRVMAGSGHLWLVAVFRGDTQALAFWESAFRALPFASVRPFEDPAKPRFRFFAVTV